MGKDVIMPILQRMEAINRGEAPSTPRKSVMKLIPGGLASGLVLFDVQFV